MINLKPIVVDFLPPPNTVEFEILDGLVELNLAHPYSEERAKSLAKDAQAILVWYPMKVTSEVIESLKNCKLIVNASTGFDNIDIRAASEKGILVCNVPDYCSTEVAEHTIALMMALARRIVWFDKRTRKGVWDYRAPFSPIPLKGKTLGLIGIGRIGSIVASIAQALGMKVLAYDPYVSSDVTKKLAVELVSLEDVLNHSDFISLHVPLTYETKGMIGKKELEMMKRSSFIINTARAELIDEEALIEALKKNRIAGAALDVISNEQEGSIIKNALFELENVIITPHIAFLSENSEKEARKRGALEIKRFVLGEPLAHIINL